MPDIITEMLKFVRFFNNSSIDGRTNESINYGFESGIAVTIVPVPSSVNTSESKALRMFPPITCADLTPLLTMLTRF